METQVIDRDELKAVLARESTTKLVMAMNDWAFAAAHIPGSIPCATLTEGRASLVSDDEIIVYCTGGACQASRVVARQLARQGFRVRRYAGGLADWSAAGEPVVGTRAA
jgi:rhodanese-related sulfurtransferase